MIASIRSRLLRFLLPGLLFIIVLAGAGVYFAVHDRVYQILDAELADGAWALALWTLAEPRGGPEVVGLNVQRELDDLLARMRSSGRGDTDAAAQRPPLEYSVSRAGRLPLLRSAGAPQWLTGHRAPGFERIDDLDGRRWHVFTVQTGEPPATVSLAEPDALRAKLVRDLLILPLLWWLLALPLAGALVWFAVNSGLRPLVKLTAAMRARSATDLRPISVATPAEIAPLMAALNDLLVRLSTLLEQERLFNAAAAHELRTPLAGIQVQAESVLEQAPDDNASDALRAILSSVARAERVLTQLLLLARISTTAAQGVELKPVKLKPLVAAVVKELAPLAGLHGISSQIECDEEQQVLADALSLGVLLRNLLENSILYSPAGSRAEICCKQLPDGVSICVSDDGPGLEPEMYRLLMKPFERGDNHDRRGAGLGLAIANRIASLHNTQLRLGPGPSGRGLAVSITLAAWHGQGPGGPFTDTLASP